MLHITPNGPMPCGVTVGTCPYGKPVDHFDNVADAQRFYEQKMFKENRTLKSTTKKSLSSRRAAESLKLTGTDKVIADFKLMKKASKINSKKEFMKKNDHILTPVSDREKAHLKQMNKVLATIK